jgi:hypothetical protein
LLLVPAVVLLAMTVGCTSDSPAEDRAQDMPADDVCGAFARDAPSAAALKAIAGSGNFTSALSEHDEVLDALREVARIDPSVEQRMQSIRFCRLASAEGGEAVLNI